jgi:hypothetical protein
LAAHKRNAAQTPAPTPAPILVSTPVSIAQVLRRPVPKPVRKKVPSSPKASTERSETTCSRALKAIDLVQRGHIQRPIDVTSLYAAVELTFMGAAEFEGGALPASIDRLYQHILAGEASFVSFPSIRVGEETLIGFGPFNDKSRFFYEEQLALVASRKARLHEETSLPELMALSSTSLVRYRKDFPDFWWDIQNDVLLFFDPGLQEKLVDILRESWRRFS